MIHTGSKGLRPDRGRKNSNTPPALTAIKATEIRAEHDGSPSDGAYDETSEEQGDRQ
jgi:hypothetical protein